MSWMNQYSSWFIITGTPVYTSPILHECQANHLIMVSDGAANNDPVAVARAKSLVNGTCPAYTDEGRCAVEIADYLKENDLRPDLPGNQTVTTHTIGFNLNSQWLSDIATEGGGYFEAESSSELVDAVLAIINNTETVDSTFVAPGAAIDQFSRVAHRNDVYLALFRPSATPEWSGNLKHYDLKGKPVNLFDADNKVAVNADGSFVCLLYTSPSPRDS